MHVDIWTIVGKHILTIVALGTLKHEKEISDVGGTQCVCAKKVSIGTFM